MAFTGSSAAARRAGSQHANTPIATAVRNSENYHRLELLRNHDFRWIGADNRGVKRQKSRKCQFRRHRVNLITESNVDLHGHARAIQACRHPQS
jgi:hypothetical protein